MKKLLLLIGLLSSPVFADWQVETFTHSASGTQSQSAMVKNREGLELAIFKTSKGIIWMDFSLSDNSFDEFSHNQLPRFQIDDQKPVQMIRGFVAMIVPADEGINAVVIADDGKISTDKDFSVDHIVAERLPERVICPIYQGASRPHLNTVEALSSGNKIRFDYVLSDGTKGHTTFTLKGAEQALKASVFK